MPSFPLFKISYILKPWKLLILTSVKKRAGTVESESEDEEKEKPLGKVVGWEKEDIDGDEEGEQEDEDQEEKWKNPYLIFLDNLDDSDEEEEVSHPSFTFLTWQVDICHKSVCGHSRGLGQCQSG